MKNELAKPELSGFIISHIKNPCSRAEATIFTLLNKK